MPNPHKAAHPRKPKIPTLRPPSAALLEFEKSLQGADGRIDYKKLTPEKEAQWELLRLERLGKVYDDNPRRPGESIQGYSNRLYAIQNPMMAKMPASAVKDFTRAVEADGGEVFKYQRGVVYFYSPQAL
jgi:hypothetical protein